MYEILPCTASRRLRWPSVRFDHVGEVESVVMMMVIWQGLGAITKWTSIESLN